jgi:hypothetical protein
MFFEAPQILDMVRMIAEYVYSFKPAAEDMGKSPGKLQTLHARHYHLLVESPPERYPGENTAGSLSIPVKV